MTYHDTLRKGVPNKVSKAKHKIGRNVLCPCGSGKKYKRCCLGRKETPLTEPPSVPSAPAPPVRQEVPTITFPGEAATMTMVPIFPSGDPRNVSDPRGLPGKYSVTVVLGRPGRFEVEERTMNFSDLLSGDSHIAIAPPVPVSKEMANNSGIRIRAQIDAGAFTFNGKPNAKGYLGKLISEPFDAQSFDDAIKRAYHAVAPSLSNW